MGKKGKGKVRWDVKGGRGEEGGEEEMGSRGEE